MHCTQWQALHALLTMFDAELVARLQTDWILLELQMSQTSWSEQHLAPDCENTIAREEELDTTWITGSFYWRCDTACDIAGADGNGDLRPLGFL